MDQPLISCGVEINLITAVKWRGSNPSSPFVGRGPQNNIEGLPVSVSEFEPQAVFQGYTCTGFGLAHLKFLYRSPHNSSVALNAESFYIDMHFRMNEI
jgi:hypothetical protein